MRKNEYTEKLSEIKAPQSAVENAVKAALEADKNRKEVIAMPKKSNIIRFISAAAACAVVVTGVAVVSNMNSQKPTIHDNSAPSQTETNVKNSFSLIVNAAEITENNNVYLSVCEDGTQRMGMETLSANKKDDGKYACAIYPMISFPVTCRGNGIDSVTFTISGANFITNKYLYKSSEDENSFTVSYKELQRLDDLATSPEKSEIEETYEKKEVSVLIEVDDSHSDSERDRLVEEAQNYIKSLDNVSAFQSLIQEGNNPVAELYEKYGADIISVNIGEVSPEDDEEELPVIGNIADIALTPTNSPSFTVSEVREYLENIENFDDFVQFKDGEKHQDIMNKMCNYYSEEIKNISVDITVHYVNGENESYTMEFIPNNVSEGFEIEVETILKAK